MKRIPPELTGYPGCKTTQGIPQWIINRIPPHRVYVEAFLGSGAIWERIAPAPVSIGIDLDEHVVAAWKNVPDIRVAHGCSIEWLRLHGPSMDESWFIYCDPPYLADRRVYYNEEMMDRDVHAALLCVLQSLPARVLISGYPTRLYDTMLKGWTTEQRSVFYHSTDQVEQIWYNYPRPTLLHDYQYLGEDKAERRKNKTRVSRWINGLHRMSIEEREQMLQAIRNEFPGPGEQI